MSRDIFSEGKIDTQAVIDLMPDNFRIKKDVTDAVAQTTIRNIILDGTIPLYKPVGFQVSSGTASGQARPIFLGRNTLMEESNLEIMNNISPLIFLPTLIDGKYAVPVSVSIIPEQSYDLEEKSIRVYADAQMVKGNQQVEVLDTDMYLFTVKSGTDATLKMVVKPVRGNTTMKQAIEIMETIDIEKARNHYMGVPTRASLTEYVRFIPNGGGLYDYRLLKGMTDEKLNLIFRHGGEQILW